MNDESLDLFDDNIVGTDNTGDDAPAETESDASVSDNVPDSDHTESSVTDIPVSGPELDGNETETDTGNSGTIPEPDDLIGENPGADGSGLTDADGNNTENENGAESENGAGTSTESGTDNTETDGEDTAEDDGMNTEILTDMNDTLHIHTENVQTFFSDTVSGNTVIITSDDNTAAFLTLNAENQILGINNQAEILDRLDTVNASIMLLFVVLVFDMLHRSAKRIVRNLMKGDRKNAADI